MPAGGRIVNVSSAADVQPLAELSAYIAAKGAIVGLTKTLAVELAPHGITVNALAPGRHRHAAERDGLYARGARDLREAHLARSHRATRRDRRCGRLSRLGRVPVHHGPRAPRRRRPHDQRLRRPCENLTTAHDPRPPSSRKRDQLASAVESVVSSGPAAGSRAVDLRVWGGIDLRLLPDRGLDIGAAWFRGTPLAWISPAGEQGPASRRRAVGSGWRATPGAAASSRPAVCRTSARPRTATGCTGRTRPAPAADLARRAHDLGGDRDGDGRRSSVHAVPPDRDHRRAGLVRIDDRVVNDSEWTAAAPLLYHVNIGVPLWDDDAYLETDADEVVPRDAAAAAGLPTWDEPPAPSVERSRAGLRARRCHVGAARRIRRLGVELTVRSSLPRLWQWVDPATGTNALALEPANCSVLGRAHDIAAGRMPFLDPGEARKLLADDRCKARSEAASPAAASAAPRAQCFWRRACARRFCSCGAGRSMK